MSFYDKSIKGVISAVRLGKISSSAAFEKLKDLPYLDLGFAKLDTHRAIRRGFGEVIYAEGKTIAQLEKIAGACLKRDSSVILTKAAQEAYNYLKIKYPQLVYDGCARIIYFTKKKPPLKKGFISIVTAGTSDIRFAEEAALTLGLMGNRVRRIYDVGVAGIHRGLNKRNIFNKSRAIIVVAGM